MATKGVKKERKAKKPRIVLRVAPAGPHKKSLWEVLIETTGESLGLFAKKLIAVKFATMTAKEIHAEGRNAQVRICGRNGRIQREYTYGDDPVRYPG